MRMIDEIILRKNEYRKRLAELILRQHSLRCELNVLSKTIGGLINTVDLGTSISSMALLDIEKNQNEFDIKIDEFKLNELEKINVRVELLKIELEKQKA